MTGTLLRKELRQHWIGLLAVLAVGLMSNLLIVAASMARSNAESPFEGLRLFTILIGMIGALVLNHRLVVVEYQARTQLFLEALPVSRWRMVTVKYFLGLAVILFLEGMALVIACLLAARHGDLTIRFATIVGARSFSTVWLVYSFCFLMGLTGRYRLALYLTLLLTGMLLIERKAVGISGFGPVVLLDARFGYEREVVPWAALEITWLLILLFSLLAAVLSLIREGSIAALLAEKMSHREKVLVAASICGLLFAAATLSEKVKKEPFDLKHASVAEEQGVKVKVASGQGEDDPVSSRLASHVAKELTAMREYLGIKELPPVFIVRRRDLDADRYDRGELVRSEGIHVQANFTSKEWQDESFIAWLVPEVLAIASKGRVKHESQRWVLDGFGLFWVGRDHLESALTQDHVLALRSLYGAQQGFAQADLHRWLSFRERVGESIASAMAWSGLKTLARRQGSDQCQKFLRAVLGARQSQDFRVLFKSNSWEHHLREQTKAAPESLVLQWQEELASARQSLAPELAKLPRVSGQVNYVPLSAETRKVKYRVVLNPAPASETRYSFLYQTLSVLDEESQPKDLQRDQNGYAQNAEAELPESYARGQRLRWTFALDVPTLRCQVISGYVREEIR